MKIIIVPDPESGVHVENFIASFRDHVEWVDEWLDEDEELTIEVR